MLYQHEFNFEKVNKNTFLLLHESLFSLHFQVSIIEEFAGEVCGSFWEV